MEKELTRLQSEYAKSRKQFENIRKKRITLLTDQSNVALEALLSFICCIIERERGFVKVASRNRVTI